MARKRVMALVAVPLIAGISAGAVWMARGFYRPGVPGFDGPAINSALSGMQEADGRLHLPTRGHGRSLENTAYAVATAKVAGVGWPQSVSAAQAGSVLDGDSRAAIWSAYYSYLATGKPAAPLGGWGAFRQKDGTYVEPPIGVRSRDRPYVVLTTWAALSAGAPASPQLKATLLHEIANCSSREFVLAHAVLALDHASGVKHARAYAELTRCIRVRRTAYAAVKLPTNEELLLDLVGRAQALELVGWPAPSAQIPYREALKATTWSWRDPWWAFHSMNGFVAAGGVGKEYTKVVQSWVPLQQAGLMPQLAEQPPTMEVDLMATLTAQSASGPWTGPSADSIMKMAGSATTSKWTDEDWAMWGRIAYTAGVQISPKASLKVRTAARRCGSKPPSLNEMRSVWHCRATHRAFGALVAWPELPEGFYQGLRPYEVVESALLLGSDPPQSTVLAAIDALVRSPATVPTHTLAQTMILASREGIGIKGLDSLRREASRRRTEGSPLYVAERGATAPDLYATYWVSLASTTT